MPQKVAIERSFRTLPPYFEVTFCPRMSPNPKKRYQYKVEPSQTNNSLGKTLKPHNVRVHDLELSASVMKAEQGKLHKESYYHLDCFMQLLPNGKIVILNKNILSQKSQQLMESLFGENFIDLRYRDYLTKPILLNFVSVKKDDQISLISPMLPPSVLKPLQDLGLRVITPDTLDQGCKGYYDENFSAAVAAILQNEGYKTADEKKFNNPSA